jgi:tetratricopeptide (TPR) repeat protein
MRNREAESWVLNGLGDLARRIGELEGARAYLEQALDTAGQIGNRWHENQALLHLAHLARDGGQGEAGHQYCLQVLRSGRELNSRSLQANALMCLGLVQESLGDLPAAAESHWEAVFLWQGVGLPSRTLEPRAGLARIALAMDDPAKGLGPGLAQARAHVEEILAALESGLGEELPGTDDPFRVYLTCARVLAAAQDIRGPALVRTALRQLEAQAATLADEAQRRTFWGITTHRELRRLAAREG